MPSFRGADVARPARGLLVLVSTFDFSTHPPIVLRAGRRYALALQGQKEALTLYLRASRSDIYADGEASVDDRPLKDAKGHSIDFAFALYARPAR